MTVLAHATDAPIVSRRRMYAMWVYAAIIVVLALTQLYSFEDFIVLIATYNLPGGERVAYAATAVLVSIEVFALPYLLRARVSPLMRIVSKMSGWIVAVTWFGLSLWAGFATAANVTNSGLLGDVVHISQDGAFAVGVALVLLASYVYSRVRTAKGSIKVSKE